MGSAAYLKNPVRVETFAGHPTAAAAIGWTDEWDTSTFNVSTDSGAQFGGKSAAFSAGTSGNDHARSFDRAGDGLLGPDREILVRVKTPASTAVGFVGGIILRGTGSSGDEDGLAVYFNKLTASFEYITFGYISNGTVSGDTEIDVNWTNNIWYWIRARVFNRYSVNGNTHCKVKIWGSFSSEPASWNISTTSTSSGFAAADSGGWCGVFQENNGADYLTFDYFAVKELTDSDRSGIDFPLQTLTLQDGTDSYTGCIDTYLNGVGGGKGTNYGTATSLKFDETSTTNDQYRGLVKFDLSDLPGNAVIASATLDLYLNTVSNGATNYADIVLRVWTEGSVTWNKYNGTNWGTAGCNDSTTDYTTTNQATSTSPASAGTVRFTVTDAVNSWLDGTYTNNGWRIASNTTTDQEFDSSESTTAAQRPKLTLTYYVPQPIHWWKLDENTGTTVYDAVGHRNGTLEGTTGTPAWVYGHSGYGLDFTRANGHRVDVGVIDATAYTAFSVFANISEDALGTSQVGSIFSRRDGTSYYRLVLIESSLNFNLRGNVYTSGVAFQAQLTPSGYSAFKGVAMTFNGSTLTVYKNDVSLSSSSHSGGTGSVTSGGTIKTSIGSENGDSTTNCHDGIIDDVRLYDVALSSDGVQAVFDEIGAPVHHWCLDDGAGTTAVDSIGNKDGTLEGTTGTPSWVTGKDILGLDYIRANGQRVDCGVITFASQLQSQGFTVTAWVNVDSGLAASTLCYVVSDGTNATASSFNLYIEKDTSGTNWRLVAKLITNSTDYSVTASYTSGWEDAWVHIAAVFDGSDTLQIFKGGTSQGTDTAGAGTANTATLKVSIGSIDGDTATNPFDGTIDDVRIYPQALDATQLAAVMADIGNPGLVVAEMNSNTTIEAVVITSGGATFNVSLTFAGQGASAETVAAVFAVNATYAGEGTSAPAPIGTFVPTAAYNGQGASTYTVAGIFVPSVTVSGTADITNDVQISIDVSLTYAGQGSDTHSVAANFLGNLAESGQGQFTAAVIATFGLAASFAGQGSFTASVLADFLGSLTTAGQADITLARSATKNLDLAVDGQAAITLAVLADYFPDVALAATGTMTPSVASTFVTDVSLAGQGATAFDVAWTIAVALNLAGQADGTFDVQSDFLGSLDVDGQASITLDALVSVLLDLALAAQGNYTAAVQADFDTDANYAGQGAITNTAAATFAGSLALDGQGAITASVLADMLGSVSLSGQGAATFDALIVILTDLAVDGQAGDQYSVAADFLGNIQANGQGAAAVSVIADMLGSIAEGGTGAAAFDVLASMQGDLAVDGQASITLDGLIVVLLDAAYAVQSAYAASVQSDFAPSTTFAGQGQIVSSVLATMLGNISAGGQGNAAFSVIATMLGNITNAGQGSIALDALHTLVVNIQANGQGSAAVSVLADFFTDIAEGGTGSTAFDVLWTLQGDVAFDGQGSDTYSVLSTFLGSLAVDGEGAAAFGGLAGTFLDLVLNGQADYTASVIATLAVAISAASTGNINLQGAGTFPRSVSESGSGSYTADVAATLLGSLDLDGQGAITLAGEIVTAVINVSLAFAGQGAMTAATAAELNGALTYAAQVAYTAAVQADFLGDVSFDGSATITTATGSLIAVTAAMGAIGNYVVAAGRVIDGSVLLAGGAGETFASQADIAAALNLDADAGFNAAVQAILNGAISVDGVDGFAVFGAKQIEEVGIPRAMLVSGSQRQMIVEPRQKTIVVSQGKRIVIIEVKP